MREKIIKFFKENWKFIIFLVCFYAIMSHDFPYVIYTPGGAINMSDRVSGDNLYDEEGSLSMTYVSMVRGRIPFLLLSLIMPEWDIAKDDEVTYDNMTYEESFNVDKIYMEEAISNAQIVAYESAGVSYNIKSIKKIITNIVDDTKNDLKIGDDILSIDGHDFEDIKSLQDYIGSKNVGDKVNVRYKRDDKEYTTDAILFDINGAVKVGISIAFINEYDTPYNIEIKTKSSEAGPSGGLITALAIYNQITEDDITNGMKIMGTGTISKDGTVGKIGGVKYKLIGAYKKGADVFICPKENYEEALSVKNEHNYDIELISAENIEDAIDKLKELAY